MSKTHVSYAENFLQMKKYESIPGSLWQHGSSMLSQSRNIVIFTGKRAKLQSS